MTKRITFILLTFTVLFNCTVNEYPEFTGIKNIKVLNASSKNITLSADAYFLNPNDVGGTLQTDQLNVYINDNKVASISSEAFEVPSKDNFKIPLTVKIPTEKIIDKNNISGLLGSLFSKQLKIQYKGDIAYKIMGFSSSYAVDEIQNVKIKL